MKKFGGIKSMFQKTDHYTQKQQERRMTANEFINVSDILDGIVYSKDNYLFGYIRIQPISLELMTKEEQNIKGKQFTSEFSGIKSTYKFFSLSRPIDVTFLIENYRRMMNETTDNTRKILLRNKMIDIQEDSLTGETLEKQFYMIFWEKNNKDAKKTLLKRIDDAISRLSNCNINASRCLEHDVIKLLTHFANPNYAHMENEEYRNFIPFIENSN